jgi:uncharacterized protein YjbI with pentapeptide repeats
MPDERDNDPDAVAADAAAERAPFDEAAWLAELFALNPWAKSFFDEEQRLRAAGQWQESTLGSALNDRTRAFQETFRRERRNQTLFRWTQPGDTEGEARHRWNTWANAMLALKRQLKEANIWENRRPVEIAPLKRRYLNVSDTDLSNLCVPGEATFTGFLLPGRVGFERTQFGDQARFDGAQFDDSARFYETVFGGGAYFARARFNELAWFERAQFSGGDTSFESVQFGSATFARAQFSGYFTFSSAEFRNRASFREAVLSSTCVFIGVDFAGGAEFSGARFSADATPDVSGRVFFNDAKFSQAADFTLCQIDFPVTFDSALFRGPVDFRSCQSCVSFSLADCSFEEVPNLIEASFHQPPRLDNLTIADPIDYQDYSDEDPRPHNSDLAKLLLVNRMKLTRDPDDEAKYRALRKLAIDAQDHERELEFHAQEIRCRRFWRDRPWGSCLREVVEGVPNRFGNFGRRTRLVSKAEYDAFQPGTEETDPDKPTRVTLRRIDKRIRPAGSGRFWFGWAYGGVSNFGRSMITPATIWGCLVVAFALSFLALQPSKAYLAPSNAPPVLAKPVFTCPVTPTAAQDSPPSLLPLAPRVCRFVDLHLRWQRDAGIVRTSVAFLSNRQCLQPVGSTPFQEAVSLSLKNALIFIGWDRREAARRTYGCLYGYYYDNNGRSFPNVPFSVSLISLVQNILSAILIFLFLLALRNLLKLK